MKKQLLIGCGSRRINLTGQDWEELVTLDNHPSLDPPADIFWDLTELPLPFRDDEFDEIHAYEVLEHTGRQGDVLFFFAQWNEFWRILKPKGLFIATVPHWNSLWAWGDPGHSRIINQGTLVFLSQAEYAKQLGKTPMSDYRHLFRGDFKVLKVQTSQETFCFVLEAIKGD